MYTKDNKKIHSSLIGVVKLIQISKYEILITIIILYMFVNVQKDKK